MYTYGERLKVIPSLRSHTRRVQAEFADALAGKITTWPTLEPRTLIEYKDPEQPDAAGVLHSVGDFSYSHTEQGNAILKAVGDLGELVLTHPDTAQHIRAVWLVPVDPSGIQ
jgi:hypothetical protein